MLGPAAPNAGIATAGFLKKPSCLPYWPASRTLRLSDSGPEKIASTTSVLGLLRLPNALQQRWVALALPWGEGLLAAAILLAPAGAPQVLAAALTLVLMASYWVVVARAMTFRPRPSCGCFGDIGDQRITGRTLARNSVLVGLAVHVANLVELGLLIAFGRQRLERPPHGRIVVGRHEENVHAFRIAVLALPNPPRDDGDRAFVVIVHG